MFDFGVTPPADGLKKACERAEAESAAIDMIAELMLASNMPESKKLTDKINKSFLAFAEPVRSNGKAEELYPVRMEVYEYLQLVSAGIDTFLSTHPAPVKECE